MPDKAKLKILFVEDEPKLRERICIMLKMHFEHVFSAGNGKDGLELFSRERPDVVVSDIMMPIMDGLAMAKRIRTVAPETPVIFCTAFTETSYLLQAIELGVAAYVRKPLDCRQLVKTIKQAATPILQRIELESSKQSEQDSMELLMGKSQAMRSVILQAQRVAGTDFSLLLQGETGAGKSHLALLIHGLSHRKQHPFFTVNLSSMPEALAESELFGHLKGAFSGAVSTKKGLFEEAHGGTLFLDDVDCAPPAIQTKILHAVEQKRFYPVGGTKPVEIDTRIITASNRNLLDEVQSGNFREDLYYRLVDLVITVPSLRERSDDIPVLARAFLHDASRELNRIPPRIAPDAILQLNRHPWPGNIRELKSVMRRAALFAGETLTAEELIDILAVMNQKTTEKNSAGMRSFEEVKRQAVRQALEATGGKKMGAARLLGIDYSSFKRMLDKYDLQ
jgi:DNA-binding NtrC family response regulator